jgi:DNA methyltransferase 1-associated protein 1
MYTDEEWNTVIKEMDDANNLTDQSLPHRTWTREETDELFKLCREYDLRFIVIHDRYTQDPTRPITIEVFYIDKK